MCVCVFVNLYVLTPLTDSIKLQLSMFSGITLMVLVWKQIVDATQKMAKKKEDGT